MEHIVQFAISIDDDGIKKHVEECALKQVSAELKNDIMREMKDKWGGLKYNIQEQIKEYMAEYKDEIIEKASNMVADSIKRSKKYREALANITEEMTE